MDATGLLLDSITETLPPDRRALRRLKIRIAGQTKMPLVRNEALLARYRHEIADGARLPDERVERILRLNAIRSQSGIATLTVITKPFPCPGRCVYCPTEARAPKSYLTNEPAVMRALRSDYDPYGQVHDRLLALHQTGHATDKIELIVKGGTWSFYPVSYQRWFIRRCFEAANAGTADHAPQNRETDGGDADATLLLEAHRQNEAAAGRIIGLTIETRPDYVSAGEILRLRELGVTRVELGVQSLEEAVLERIVRDHGVAEVRQATRLLKDAGFKVAYHLMPNLPGATPESDLESARRLFEDADFQPDAVKLYPCVVVESAQLHQWWRDGRYEPYSDETLITLLADIKRLVPPYVRIERVIRDIPSTSIAGGCQLTNLRETVLSRMRAQGLHCRCIRCRQVREPLPGDYQPVRRTFEASGGMEEFLSFEDAAQDRLAALLRLRIPAADSGAPSIFPELTGSAIVRELHAYGEHLPLGGRSVLAVQHQGFGQRLLECAESIARDTYGLGRIAVISGIGARGYYRKFGYTLCGTYMVKPLR
jgi:elongator complex protein 3